MTTGEALTIDDLIDRAELIIIGEVKSALPSRWNTSDGRLPGEVTVDTITPDMVIFTDVDFNVRQYLKGKDDYDTVRIRALGGKVEQDEMIVSGGASLENGKTYLLFIEEDITGSTADIDPGHYWVLGGLQGVYEIINQKAVSVKDEWVLDDLIQYIQKALAN